MEGSDHTLKIVLSPPCTYAQSGPLYGAGLMIPLRFTDMTAFRTTLNKKDSHAYKAHRTDRERCFELFSCVVCAVSG